MIDKWCQIYHFMNWRDTNVQTYEKFANPGGAVGFSGFRGRIWQGRGNSGGGVETPVGAMLWDK